MGIWIGGGARAEDRGVNPMLGLRLGTNAHRWGVHSGGKSAQVARGLKNALMVG